MTTLSNPTLGLLIGAAEPTSASNLKTLLMETNLYDYGHQDTNKQELLRSRLLGAREAAQAGDATAQRALLTFARRVIESLVRDPESPPAWFDAVCESLLADGYQLTWNRPAELDKAPWELSGENIRTSYEILPTDPAPVPLATAITALEAELSSRGYTTALSHYRQAVDNFSHHNYEASNGQLRTTLESVVVQLAKENASPVGQGRAAAGGDAIDRLVTHTSALPERDGGRLLRGLWQMSHTQGSHPGPTTADEARIRMQMITAMLRLLLGRFPR